MCAMNATVNVSTNVTNTITINLHNVMSTLSPNSDGRKVIYKMDFHILDTALLVIILLLINAIICYHYTKNRSKQKSIGALVM